MQLKGNRMSISNETQGKGIDLGQLNVLCNLGLL